MRKKAVVFAAHSAVLFAALFAYTPMIDAKVSEASLREHISVLASVLLLRRKTAVGLNPFHWCNIRLVSQILFFHHLAEL
jgi:hypothetical protein